jgi:hypothetical protein
MSLRKSPRRTPGLLAANRRNALKSTGPRTSSGKRRIVLNALKHGLRSRNLAASLAKFGRGAEELESLRRALALAFLPETKSQWREVFRMAADVWTCKREAQRWASSPERLKSWAARNHGALPPPQRFFTGTIPAKAAGAKAPSPGWKVAVTVWFRRGRGRTGERVVQPGYGWDPGQATLHAGVRVACTGHPAMDLGPWPVFLPTKPESHRKRKSYLDVSPDSELVGRVTGMAELWLGQNQGDEGGSESGNRITAAKGSSGAELEILRTEPEYARKQKGWINTSISPVTELAKRLISKFIH